MDSSKVLPANSDIAVNVKFKNKYNDVPMVVPLIYARGGTWAYAITMVSQLTTDGCIINIHSLENVQRTISVGYIALGNV